MRPAPTAPRPSPWTEPGAWTLAPGVHRIPLPLPNDALRAVNVYAIESADGLTLIDGGWAIPEARAALADALRCLGYRTTDVRRVLVTHIHRDHYTLAALLRAEHGAVVSLGVGERPALDVMHQRTQDVERHNIAALLAAGAPHLAERWERGPMASSFALEDFPYPDDWLADETELDVGRPLTALATPGHTQGHMVFVDDGAGLLFAGDHVLSTITPSIGLEVVRTRDSLGDFLRSLRRIRAMPDLRLLPAHGPVLESAHARVEELLGFHDVRLGACLAAVPPPGVTAHQVAGQLGWTRRERRLDELDDFDAALATLETAAHLDLLVVQGRLVRDSDAGGDRYRPNTPHQQENP